MKNSRHTAAPLDRRRLARPAVYSAQARFAPESAVLLLEPPHFGEDFMAGLAATARLVVASHHCVIAQYRSQSDDEHLALLVEAADVLCGPQLTVLKRLDLAARDGQSVFAHVRLLLFESKPRPRRAPKTW